ncbi:hypothetical protein U1Q18_044746 [Sarracenia purpurea var. burkii]
MLAVSLTSSLKANVTLMRSMRRRLTAKVLLHPGYSSRGVGQQVTSEDVSKLMSLITADQKRGTDTNACIRHCAGIFLWPIRKKDAPAYQSCACAVRFSRHRGAWRASSDLERSMEHILMRAESLLAREPNARLSCI